MNCLLSIVNCQKVILRIYKHLSTIYRYIFISNYLNEIEYAHIKISDITSVLFLLVIVQEIPIFNHFIVISIFTGKEIFTTDYTTLEYF